ncbi:MAG: molybdate ABC transporter permease subunit [Chthoniobacterales bacterium]
MPVIAHTLLWAGLTTLLVMTLGTPLSYALARHDFFGKRLISTLTSLPLVLPPTAVGYLLLRLLADDGLLGQQLLGFDLNILLTWKAVIVACSIMSMPLVIRAARVSFEEVDPKLEDMARTLGFKRIQVFFLVTLPLASRGLAAAMILGFTRAMGEFGATVIVAGNIPGRTQTLASAIFSAQQAGRDDRADFLTITALIVGFCAIFATEWLTRPRHTKQKRKSKA